MTNETLDQLAESLEDLMDSHPASEQVLRGVTPSEVDEEEDGERWDAQS